MTTEERLQAILRRAERGRSYGRLMMPSKDLCLDDVIRLAREGLALAAQQQDAAASAYLSLTPAAPYLPDINAAKDTLATVIAQPTKGSLL